MTRRMLLPPDCGHHLRCQLRAPLSQASLRERALRSHLHLEANTGLCKYCLQQTPRNQTQLRCRYRSLLVECKIRTRRGLCVTACRRLIHIAMISHQLKPTIATTTIYIPRIPARSDYRNASDTEAVPHHLPQHQS
jgi:hypothetical protein